MTVCKIVMIWGLMVSGIFAVRTLVYGESYPNTYPVYRIANGMEVSIKAEDVESIDDFQNKPEVFLLSTENNNRGAKKYKLKILSYNENEVVFTAMNGIPVGIYELWIKQKKTNQSSSGEMVSNNFNIRPPTLTSISGNSLVAKEVLQLTGYYFGSKFPKVYIEYQDAGTGKTRTARVKVDKNNLKYSSLRERPVPMNSQTNESYLTLITTKDINDDDGIIKIHVVSKNGNSFIRYRADTKGNRATAEAGQLISATFLNQSKYKVIINTLKQLKEIDNWWKYVGDLIELINLIYIYSTLDCYQLVYYTENPLGGLQVVSGIIYVPRDDDDDDTTYQLPFLVQSHGTLIDRDSSPSLNMLHFESYYAHIFAWLGNIVLMPDYPGLGVNYDQQPYLNIPATNSIVDMLKAGKEFLANDYTGNAEWSGVTNLIGYSQGGYNTMVVANRLQENYQDEFPISFCAPLDGPHSLSDTMLTLMRSLKYYKEPYFLPLLMNGYDAVYKNQTTVFDLMNSVKDSAGTITSGYNTRLYDLLSSTGDLVTGETSYHKSANKWTINGMNDPTLEIAARDILTDDFVDILDSDSSIMYELLQQNDSFRGWIPTTFKMKMFHAEQDDVIYVNNTKIAYQAFLDQGASSDYLMEPEVYSLELEIWFLDSFFPDIMEHYTVHYLAANWSFLKAIIWITEQMNE